MSRLAAALALCWIAALVADYTPLGEQLDNSHYDAMLTQAPVAKRAASSIVVAIDDATLREKGGVAQTRAILTGALHSIALGKPKAVAIDIVLADASAGPTGDAQAAALAEAQDAALAEALAATPNLVLPCQLLQNDRWEFPLERFRKGAAIGHVQRPVAAANRLSDGISRELNLEEIADNDRRWALSLEALRLAAGEPRVVESPSDLQIGGITIPAPRDEHGRTIRIRYVPEGTLPQVSVLELEKHPEVVRDKTVFVGITEQSATRDRLESPFEPVTGVSVHQNAYETLASGRFLVPANYGLVMLVCALFAAAPAVAFRFLPLAAAYPAIVAWLAAAHFLPALFFRYDRVFPYVALVGSSWLAAAVAATYQHFFVRRQLTRTESEKSRYQQAIHWAAHEMRTPLTSIQGSAEIMSRYKLPDEKRQQFSEMIHSESKRLARIITTFLDVERLNEGQMEMKREPFSAAEVVEACVARARPIGERKKITMTVERLDDATLHGDRELMEYAAYNLLTNAVKYSPAQTAITVSSQLADGELRVAVRDQGIGMDAKEVKKVFQKFYRTKKAEASGETGTGIGLSIVEQIVTHHGGRMEVTSEPGKGSCFTIVLKAAA